MKKAFVIISGILLFTSCQKKAPQTHSYDCVIMDSIPPGPAAQSIYSGIHSNMTDAEINLYVKVNTTIDTLYFNGVKKIQYQTTTCQLDQ